MCHRLAGGLLPTPALACYDVLSPSFQNNSAVLQEQAVAVAAAGGDGGFGGGDSGGGQGEVALDVVDGMLLVFQL